MLRIVFVPGAEPAGSPRRLATEQEYLDIEAAMRAVRDDIEVTFMHAPTPRRIRRALEAGAPVVAFHYGGHGRGDGATPGTRDMMVPGDGIGVYLPDDAGNGRLVPLRSLVAILKAARPRLRLAVVMACHGEALAKGLLEVVDSVVTVEGELGDVSAVRFAAVFWARMAMGNSLGEAVRYAQDALVADQSADDQRVRYYVRDGLDADHLILFPPIAPAADLGPDAAMPGADAQRGARAHVAVAPDAAPPPRQAPRRGLVPALKRMRSCALLALAMLMTATALARIAGIIAGSARGSAPVTSPVLDPSSDAPVFAKLPPVTERVEDREPAPFPEPPHAAVPVPAPTCHAPLDKPCSHGPRAGKHRGGPDSHHAQRPVSRLSAAPTTIARPPLTTLPAELAIPPLGAPPSVLAARRSPAVPEVAATDAPDDVDGDKLQRYLQRHTETLSTCYRQRQLVRPDLAGTVTATFVIGASGSVESSSATGLDPDVSRCVAGMIKTIAFPAPRTRIEMTYRFHFVPKH